MNVEIVGLQGLPEVGAGDDLAGLILGAVAAAGIALADGDVLAVTQKVVSKAEGRMVPLGPDGKAAWVARETRRVVARRGDLLIAETPHGFVCANAGVDESNVIEGFVTLLPEDPDASAEGIRNAVAGATSADVAVVVTDTFGRAWRRGLVNVAIGCAGLPSLVDLRGTKDALGRVLAVTVEALADEVAAAAGLVMGKADGVPVALVRGIRAEASASPASSMVRAAEEDLFRESPLQSLYSAGRPVDRFGSTEVAREVLLEAVSAACAAVPEAAPRALFVSLDSRASRQRLRAALRGGDRASGDPSESPAIVVACVRTGSGDDPGLAPVLGGALVQSLGLGLRAQGLAFRRAWLAPTRAHAIRDALGLEDHWVPMGAVAVGAAPEEEPVAPGTPRPPDPGPVIREI